MFIAIEGPDGSGKTTVARELGAWLDKHYGPTKVLADPGSAPVLHLIQGGDDLMTMTRSREMGPLTRAALFQLARVNLAEQVIQPAIDDGHHVIVDRWTPSTAVYQGWLRNLDMEEWIRTSRLLTGGLEPDLYIFLNAKPTLLAERVNARFEDESGKRRGFYDAEDLEHYSHLGRAYTYMMHRFIRECGESRVVGYWSDGKTEDLMNEVVGLVDSFLSV